MSSSLDLVSGMIGKLNVVTRGLTIRDLCPRSPVQIRSRRRLLITAATTWAILTSGGVAIAQTTSNPNYTGATSKSIVVSRDTARPPGARLFPRPTSESHSLLRSSTGTGILRVARAKITSILRGRRTAVSPCGLNSRQSMATTDSKEKRSRRSRSKPLASHSKCGSQTIIGPATGRTIWTPETQDAEVVGRSILVSSRLFPSLGSSRRRKRLYRGCVDAQ